MQKPRLTIFLLVGMSGLAASRQVPAPLSGRQNQNTPCDLPVFVSALTTLPASPFLAVNAQAGRFTVQQATVSEGANFAFCTCSNACLQIYNQLSSGDRVTWR